jgi:hypothetical protein
MEVYTYSINFFLKIGKHQKKKTVDQRNMVYCFLVLYIHCDSSFMICSR